MDGETVTLIASGYPWTCPDCKTRELHGIRRQICTNAKNVTRALRWRLWFTRLVPPIRRNWS